MQKCIFCSLERKMDSTLPSQVRCAHNFVAFASNRRFLQFDFSVRITTVSIITNVSFLERVAYKLLNGLCKGHCFIKWKLEILQCK